MSNLKKVIVATLSLAMAFSFATGVLAEEEEEVDDEIAEITELAEELGIDADVLLESMGISVDEDDEDEGDTDYEEVSIAGIPEGFTFTENMRQGARGDAVKYLQILLNTNEDTKVAQEGPGSPGNETEYFGPVTHAAVVTFQEKYASEVLEPVGLQTGTGYVGPSTRAKLNELLTGEEVVDEDSTPNLSAVLEQLQALAEALETLQARLDELEEEVGTPEDAVEGELSTELRADVRNVELKANETKDVAMFRAEAENSDITIQRFDVWVDGTMTDFRNDIDHMALKVDGEVIGEKEISRSTVERGDDYIRFSGLNVEVLEGGYKDFTIEVTATNDDDFNTTYGVAPKDDEAIRGIDGANLTVYAGGASYRNFDVVPVGSANLTLEDADSPVAGVVQLDIDDNTEVELLNFDITPEDSDMDFESLRVDFEADWTNATNDDDLSDVFQDVLLYHDGDLVDVVTITATGDTGYAEFAPEMEIEAGTAYNFTVVADVFGMDIDDATERDRLGVQIMAKVDESENTDNAYAYETESYEDITDDLNGNYQALYSTLPDVSLTDSDISKNADGDTANAYLTMDFEALVGDINITDISVKDEDTNGGTGSALANDGWDVIIEIDGTEVYSSDASGFTSTTLNAGDIAEVEVLGVNPDSGWVRLGIDSITWKDEAGQTHTWNATDYEFIEELRTGRVNISL